MSRGYGRYRRRRPAARPAPRSLVRRAVDIVLMLLFFGLVALLAARLNPRPPVEPLAGSAYVIDGDTISIRRQHIRLKGIDAPELAQTCGTPAKPVPCGQVSRQSLVRLIGGRQVRCIQEGRDRYERVLARCFVGEVELNGAMVAMGQAIAYGDYRTVELQARMKRVGLWAGDFETPQDWRREHEHSPEPPQPQRDPVPGLLDPLVEWVNSMLGG
ncbi:MAG: thermonuclease family protein, partial [Phyllobacterium sp.]